MNRAQRRAAAQGKGPRTVKYYKVPLTPPELEIVAEALDAYRLQMDDMVDEGDRTDLQEWAYRRAGAIRDILQAELEGRPYHDVHAERLAPGEDADDLGTSVLA